MVALVLLATVRAQACKNQKSNMRCARLAWNNGCEKARIFNLCPLTCNPACSDGAATDPATRDTCYFIDECNNKPLSASPGETLKDSCGSTYNVDEKCKLISTTCNYKDHCNGEQISARRGGELQDSCGGLFSVDENCHLTLIGAFSMETMEDCVNLRSDKRCAMMAEDGGCDIPRTFNLCRLTCDPDC